MLTSLSVGVEVAFEIIWKKEKPEYSKHDEEFKQNDQP